MWGTNSQEFYLEALLIRKKTRTLLVPVFSTLRPYGPPGEDIISDRTVVEESGHGRPTLTQTGPIDHELERSSEPNQAADTRTLINS